MHGPSPTSNFGGDRPLQSPLSLCLCLYHQNTKFCNMHLPAGSRSKTESISRVLGPASHPGSHHLALCAWQSCYYSSFEGGVCSSITTLNQQILSQAWIERW